MNFTFPKEKVLNLRILKNYSNISGRDNFELIDISKPLENQIQIKGIDYIFTYLSESGNNKGGHSIILKLYVAQNIDVDNPFYEEPDLILKIHKNKKKKFPDQAQNRFNNEINALQKCKEKGFQNIIKIEHFGECKIFNHRDSKYDIHQYYTMEFAPYDLKSFIEKKHADLTLEQKLNLCIDLAKGLKELNQLKLYHRDIKPDNIFMNSEGNWKIGDLGLIDDRNRNFQIDNSAELIGPRGWISPEAMNKYLTEDKGFEHSYHCGIDHVSDIFQLGKVFWYIFQYNAPIGTVKESDFKLKNGQIYSILKRMLNHSRTRRFNDIDDVINQLKMEERKLLKNRI